MTTRVDLTYVDYTFPKDDTGTILQVNYKH